jgi:hypothetical protein
MSLAKRAPGGENASRGELFERKSGETFHLFSDGVLRSDRSVAMSSIALWSALRPDER